MKKLKFEIETVFVDIDTTLVDPRPDAPGVAKGIDCLVAELVAERNGIATEAAAAEINKRYQSVGDMVGRHWPFGVLDGFNVTEAELWEILAADARKHLFMHPDAREFLVMLRRMEGVKVFTATTNPRLIILAKLALGGLANAEGSPYFEDCFGGEEVYPGGKCIPDFFSALLQLTGARPETTLMVGDSPTMDLALAKAAGIHQVVLPRRSQTEEWTVENDGGLYVRDLETAIDLISAPA